MSRGREHLVELRSIYRRKLYLVIRDRILPKYLVIVKSISHTKQTVVLRKGFERLFVAEHLLRIFPSKSTRPRRGRIPPKKIDPPPTQPTKRTLLCRFCWY